MASRRRRSKTRKWLATGGLVLAMAGGLYLLYPQARDRDVVRPQRPVADAPRQAATPVKARVAVSRTEASKAERPVAPAAMPVDAPRTRAAPRPEVAVGARSQ